MSALQRTGSTSVDGLADPATQWHTLAVAEVLAVLETSAEGLDAAEAAHRLIVNGPNQLPAPPRTHPVLRFLAHFNNMLIYFLLAAAAAAGFLGHFVDAGVIVAVVLINAIVGFVQEGRAEQALAAIREMIAPHATVLRGRWPNASRPEWKPWKGTTDLSRQGVWPFDVLLILFKKK